MAQTETTYFILDSHQGGGGADGWRKLASSNLQINPGGLQLETLPSPPVPLKDEQGAFGGLENPTGIAVAADGAIYVSDSKKHSIYRIVRRKKLLARARFFRIAGGRFSNDRFLYVPLANRLEQWPRSLGRDPKDFSEVVVICETVWNEDQARKLILSFIHGGQSKADHAPCCTGHGHPISKKNCGCAEVAAEDQGAIIEKEWEDFYPSGLPVSDLCKTSIGYLPCLGGPGSTPRLLNEPRGLAISSEILYVADSKNHRVQAFTLRGLVLKAVWGKRAGFADLVEAQPSTDCLPAEGEMVRLGQPVAGVAPGQFNEPWDVAADERGNLYIADKGNHRVQKFDCRSRRFKVIDGRVLRAHFFQALYGPASRERFVFIPARRRLENWPHALGHDPLDISEVKVLGETVATTEEARRILLESLDAKGATDIFVEWDSAYPDALADWPQPEPSFSSPTHIAIDKAGRLFVVEEDKDYVKFLDSDGRVLGRVEFVSEVSGPFKPTAVAIDAEGNLLLADQKGIHRFHVGEEQYSYEAFFAIWHDYCAGMAVDAEGSLLAIGSQIGVSSLNPPEGFFKNGDIISGPVDSEIENCQWHKLVLNIPAKIALGTSLTVWTYTSETKRTQDEILNLDEQEWRTGQVNADNFLILSGPGRFLWLKMVFKGNGVDTPVVQSLSAYFPRTTYLEYLPAVYHADPVSKDFLERFLSIFENILSGLEDEIDNIWQLFDPDGVPAAPKDFLSWLAGWIDMVFEPSWSIETRRRLLRNAPELYRARGTPAGLKMLLKLAMGAEVQILEHFQLRRWLLLNAQASLGNASELWGNCIVNRLQLDEHSSIGDFALVGTGDPVRDPFFVYAHRFSVFVQATLVSLPVVERMMRYLIEREKPAHTDYSLVKVEPRFRIGMQSTIGLDTQVGAYPQLVLNRCATLGYDTLLGCDPQEKAPARLKVGERSRVGVSAVVG